MPEPVPSNLSAEAAALPVTDWDAHRRFAQGAATEGYAAEVEQVFTNDRADGEYMLTHRTTLSPYDPQQQADSSAIHEDEGPMGDTRTVETFTPDRPEGYYGARTPWEDAPYLSPAQELASDALTRLTALNRDDPEQMSDSRLAVAGKDVVDVGAAVAVMGDSSAAQTALEVGGPQARPLISC